MPDCHATILALFQVVSELESKLRLFNHKVFGNTTEQLKYITEDIKKKFEEFKKAGLICQGDLFGDVEAEFNKLMKSVNPEVEQTELEINAKDNNSENKEPKTKKLTSKKPLT